MASRGKAVQPDHMFVADFETTDTRKPVDENDIPPQRVWLAGLQNVETEEKQYFLTLDAFMAAIMSRGDNQNTEIAIHNLKFDGSYIVPYLLDNGYTCVQRKAGAGEFNVLIDERNNWYTIRIQVTKRRRVLLWDSLKLFPMALEYLPDLYGTPTRKIAEDSSFYTKERPEGYEVTARDYEYFDNDLQVLTEALQAHIKHCGVQFKKTQASQAFHEFEKSFPAWKWRFPALTTEMDKSIRTAYWGGISHAADEHKGKDCEDIGVFDINSSYPDKAANKRLPYGTPLYEWGEGQSPDMSKFWIADALVEFKLKKGCLPCIPAKALTEGKPFVIEKWLNDSEGIIRMTFCSIDFQTMRESYDFKVWRWLSTVHWAWKIQKEIQKFVLTNNEQKVVNKQLAKDERDPVKRQEFLNLSQRAKINNNSFYGKFGEEVIKYGKSAYLLDDDIIYKMDREDEQGMGKRKFLPVAIAITAWGRQQLVRMANILGEHFIYCDTDSIHYLMSGHYKIEAAIAAGIFEVDDTKLGAWKYEGHMVWGRYLRAKCYMEETDEGKLEATVAGLPADKHTGMFSKQRSCLTKENFHIGYVVPAEQSNKLRTVRTRTGNKLVPTGFKIKETASLFSL